MAYRPAELVPGHRYGITTNPDWKHVGPLVFLCLEGTVAVFEGKGGEVRVAVGDLARIDLIQGAPAKALPLLKEAQRIASGVGDVALDADIQGALGRCRLEQLDFGNGASAFSEGLDLSIMIKDLARQVRFLMAQVELLAHPDNPALDRKEALAKARLAVHLSRNGELSVKDRVTALDSLASVFLALNRPRSAFAIIRKSLRILQKENGEEGMKTDFLKRYQALARKLGKKGEPMP
jgi:hypothetical protein